MHRKISKSVLLLILAVSLTACSNNSTESISSEEQTNDAVNESIAEVFETNENISDTSTSKTEYINDTESTEEETQIEQDKPDTPNIGFEGNITESSDGTYNYSEQFMAEMRKRPYFEGATDEEIITFLDEVIGYFDGVEDEIDSEMMNSMLDAFDGGNLHEENLVIAESESGVTQNVDRNNNGSGSNNNNGGKTNNQGGNTATQQNPPAQEPEVITDPNYQMSGGNSAFGGFTVGGSIGGGPQVVPDGFVVH